MLLTSPFSFAAARSRNTVLRMVFILALRTPRGGVSGAAARPGERKESSSESGLAAARAGQPRSSLGCRWGPGRVGVAPARLAGGGVTNLWLDDGR